MENDLNDGLLCRGASSIITNFLGDHDEVYTGLRAQDLQEAKDQLVVETADMLHIPLFTAEALLRDNGKKKQKNFLTLLASS